MSGNSVMALSGTERMARLDRSFGPSRRSGGGSGSSFGALLANATARQRTGGGVSSAVRPGGTPAGVLGMQLLSSSDAPLFDLSAIPATPATTTSSDAGAAVIEAAKSHLGVPYLWGGTDAVNGFDCSGLVQDAFRQIGVEMPKWSRHQAEMGVKVPSIDEARPGDVLTFGQPVSHVALYMGDGQMLHAPKTGEVVKIQDINRPINSIRRIVSESGQRPTTTGGILAPAAPGSLGVGIAATKTISAWNSAEEQYRPLFEAAGARWNVDPKLLAAVAKTESAFNPNARSSAGAQGLMQFMPATAAEMGVDPLDPASAIDGAARYLRKSLDQFGSTELAIASYNAGRGAVSRHNGVPPFKETINYVDKVLDAWRSRS